MNTARDNLAVFVCHIFVVSIGNFGCEVWKSVLKLRSNLAADFMYAGRSSYARR